MPDKVQDIIVSNYLLPNSNLSALNSILCIARIIIISSSHDLILEIIIIYTEYRIFHQMFTNLYIHTSRSRTNILDYLREHACSLNLSSRKMAHKARKFFRTFFCHFYSWPPFLYLASFFIPGHLRDHGA